MPSMFEKLEAWEEALCLNRFHVLGEGPRASALDRPWLPRAHP